MKSVGLYIHIPFCIKKCAYCDFPSYSGMEDIYGSYVSALTEEIKTRGKMLKGHRVKSVFFGGGTPTVLSEDNLHRLTEEINKSFLIDDGAEMTIEANPGTLDIKKARALREMGFDRLSMGVQTWQNSLLKVLGRIHTIEEFQQNFHAAREAGFDNVNTDIMFALPGQTFDDWRETLENITRLGVEHISAYSLILEEGTPFYAAYERGELTPMDDETDRRLYHYAVEFLKEKGYEQYEISNFAKPGKRSRHNCIYWQLEPYLGLGLGAHSFFQGYRFHNTYNMKKYLNSKGEIALLTEENVEVTRKDAMEEFMFLGLRMTEGISEGEYFARFGENIYDAYGDKISRLIDRGLIKKTDNGIALTDIGVDISNTVFTEFML